MVDRPLYSMLLCHRRSIFPIRVYNHRRDCTGENPSGRATYVIDIPDDGTLSSLGVGWSRYEAHGRRCRTNGWKVRVYFAKRARLTNRTNPPPYKSTHSSTIPPPLKPSPLQPSVASDRESKHIIIKFL